MYRTTAARLGLVVVAAAIGMTTAIGPAGADPTSPPTTDTTDPTPTASTPPGDEPSSQPNPSIPSSSEPREQSTLSVAATFDKASYRTGETMTIRFAVTNTGAEPVGGVTVSPSIRSEDDVHTDRASWGALNTGATIEAGATLTVTVTGRVTNPATTSATLRGTLSWGEDGLVFSFDTRVVTERRLGVTVAFGKDIYGPGERVTLTVTLSNPDDTPLTGVTARGCDRYRPANLTGVGPGWAALSSGGVDIEPHGTVVRTVWEAMPATAPNYGHVDANCAFGALYAQSRWATDRARVPGRYGSLALDFGEPGVRVYVATDAHCPIVAHGTSGAGGRAVFGHLPAGEYDVYMYPRGPRRVDGEYPQRIQVTANATHREAYGIVEAHFPLRLPPAQPAGCAQVSPPASGPHSAAPQGKAGGLAYTGASVAAVALTGLAVLVLGAAGVAAARRRKA